VEINQDLESQRLHRNQTKTQIRTSNLTREGVLVNSNIPLNETCNSLLISDRVELPNKLYERDTKKEKGLLPICIATTGIMGALVGITALIAKSSKDTIDVDLAQKLPSLTRNVCINKEINQAIYRIVASPSKKTLLAGAGVAAMATMGFMGETFSEGFRDVWVKKKEADIHKNLQENLIDVETQSFAGKLQINRSMLSKKAEEFTNALKEDDNAKKDDTETFKSHHISFKSGESKNSNNNLSFGKNKNHKEQNSFVKNLGYLAMGVASLGSIVGLGYLSIKNIRKSSEHMKTGVDKIKGAIDEIITNTKEYTSESLGEEGSKNAKKISSTNIMNLLVSINAKPEYVKETADKMHWHDEDGKKGFVEDTIFNLKKSTEKANSALGGSGEDRNTFYSHVTDYTAFFYNWLLDSSNKQFKNLFLGITGASAAAFVGETAANAIKDVQVKKYNADTELSLQKRLVPTELRNFKSKKEAAINPLSDEFYKQKESGKPKEELKVMADSILNEIKNGAPYIYS